MNMEDDFFKGTFSVNLDEVIKSATYSSIVKMLALQIKQNSYLTVGDFFRKLSDNDLESLVDAIEEANLADEESYEESSQVDDLILLALMLSQAEGGAEEDIDEVYQKINCLCMLAVTTSLHRKGLVEVYYENFSLQQDANENIIAKRKDGVDYDSFLDDEDE
jgi:hypothetical protein